MGNFKINGQDATLGDWNAVCQGFRDIYRESLENYVSDNELTHDEIVQILDSDKSGAIGSNDFSRFNAGSFQSMEGMLRKHGFRVSEEIRFDDDLTKNIKNIPNHLWSNREFVLAAVRHDASAFGHADPSLKGDRDFALVAVSQNDSVLGHISKDFQIDPEFINAAENARTMNTKEDPRLTMTDRGSTLAAVKRNGMLLMYADASLRSDPEMVLSAVMQNGLALQYADASLRNDPEIVRAAVGQNGWAIRYAGEAFRRDPETVRVAVSQNGLALRYADASLRNDPEMVLSAVMQNGLAIEFADPSLKRSREMVLAAVRENGLALRFTGEQGGKDSSGDSLGNDPEIFLAAIRENGMALQYADASFKRDPQMVLEAMRHGSRDVIGVADPSLGTNRDFVLATVGWSGKALQYVDERLRNDEEFVSELARVNIGILAPSTSEDGSAPSLGVDTERVWGRIRAEYYDRFHAMFSDAELNTFSDLRSALNERYGIEFIERFRSVENMLHVLELRNDPSSASGRTAVLVFPKTDYNGAFSSFGAIDRLTELGYDVLYYEAGNEADAKRALEEATMNGERMADAVILAGHGTMTTLQLGEQPDETATIDTSDFGNGADELELSRFIERGGDLIEYSCSNGSGGADEPKNLANTIADTLTGTGVNIWSSPIAQNVADITLENGRLKVQWTEADAYVPLGTAIRR